ncbi:MAG: tetratricopeptide repeat protein [Bacteroidetes bacterium]|nr:tetratricopeptide repeat protein [Bacteroidota bacterium]
MNFEEIRILLNQAREANTTGNYSEAERIATIVLSETKINDENYADALLVLASSTGRRSKYTEAISYAESALELAVQHARTHIEIQALHILGNAYFGLASNTKALEYFQQALLKYNEVGDKSGINAITGNIGNIFVVLGLFDKALEYYQKSLSGYEESKDLSGEARLLGNIAGVYMNLASYEQALEYYKKALSIREKLGEFSGIAIIYGNIGGVYGCMELLNESIEYLNKALVFHKKLNNNYDIAFVMMTLGSTHKKLGDYEIALELYLASLSIQNELSDKFLFANSLGDIGRLYSEPNFNLFDGAKAKEYFHQAIAVSIEIDAKLTLYRVYKALAELYKREKEWEEFALYFEKYHNVEKEVQSEEAKESAKRFDSERKNAESEKQLAVERARAQVTDEILANILPPTITERLIKGEKKIADTHEKVSVLFVDIVGFTKLSTKVSADELIDLLDIIFTRFDTICKKYGLEKIKTIGDAYMAVCGAPDACENHAQQTAYAALEMLEDFEIGQKFSEPIILGFRVGLHSGSVVAGIIGQNKYSYDLWGDAVNTASRMESHGEAGKIHVSEEFRNTLISTTLNELPIQFIPRGEMEIKGKGIMKTFFLEKA